MARLVTTTPTLFITLTTSKRTAPTPDAAFFLANRAFANLIKRWRRLRPDCRLEYFLVWERTKAGWPHIHALIEGPLVSKHWLSHTWNELTRSYVVDLQQVKDARRAMQYVAKYLTKDPAAPYGFRRWRRSAGMFRHFAGLKTPKLPHLSQWRLLHRSPEAMLCTFTLHGLAVETDQQGVIHARDDPALHAQQLTSHGFEALLASLPPRELAIVTDWPFWGRTGLRSMSVSEAFAARA